MQPTICTKTIRVWNFARVNRYFSMILGWEIKTNYNLILGHQSGDNYKNPESCFSVFTAAEISGNVTYRSKRTNKRINAF